MGAKLGPSKTLVKAATLTALPTNTRGGNTLTASAPGALSTIDGVTLGIADRLLVKNEATPANNGVYVIDVAGDAGTPWAMTRASDCTAAAQMAPAMIVPVASGGAGNGGGKFALRPAALPIIVNSTALYFTDVSTYSAAFIAGFEVDPTPPVTGQVLIYDGATAKYKAGTVTATPALHASSHVTGTDQLADAVGGISPVHGLMSTGDKTKLDGVATGADVTGANNPKAHNLSHMHGGGDEVATATAAANAIPKADGTGKLDAGWLPAVGGFTNNMVGLTSNDSTDSSNYVVIGDLTLAGGTFFGAHTVKFSVSAFVTGAALTGTIILYNVTDSAIVATLTYTELIATRKDSAALVLDAASKLYEVRYKVTGGASMAHRIICMWSGFEITT